MLWFFFFILVAKTNFNSRILPLKIYYLENFVIDQDLREITLKDYFISVFNVEVIGYLSF